MLQFTPLSAPYVQDDAKVCTEQPKALAYLLEVDQSRILLDCGAPEDLTFARDGLPAILAKLAPTIDVVLLAHAEMAHMGLYAYAHAKYGLQCPVYATLPVQTLGRLQMHEVVKALRGELDADADADAARHDVVRCIPTEAQVDDAFDAVRTVRYMQPTALEGRCAGLVLTAYHAGHSLGGTVWKLRSPSIGTVVMALDWHHHRERHLDGTALLSVGAAAPLAHAIGRPDVLITDMERGLITNARRKDRDAALLDQIHRTLTSGHSVLIPIDSGARLLEVLVLLDQHWAFKYQHQRFPLCLVSHTGQEVVERARTFMEWMSREWAIQLLEPSGRKKGGTTKSPLDFPSLRYFSSVDALHKALTPSQAKVVLATPPALTHGLARHLLADFLSDPEALVVLLSRGAPSSLVRVLWERWNAAQSDVDGWKGGQVGESASVGGHLSYELCRRVALAGDELRAYLEAEKAKHAQAESEAKARGAAVLHAPAGSVDDDDPDDPDDDDPGASSDSSDDEEPIAPQPREEPASFDMYVRGTHRLFPVVERKRKVDGYGEFIDTSRWLARRRRLEAEQDAQLDPAREKKAPQRAPAPEVPSKYTSERRTVSVRCRVLYMDMQGVSDGRALTTLVPQLQPRRLLMVNGDTATSLAMRDKFGTHDVYMPSVGTTVAIGGLTNSYTVRLGDALMSQLRWRPMHDYNIVHLHVRPEATDDAPTLVPVHDAATMHAAQAPSTLYIGDLRLSALKAYLARQHRIRADFAGEGVLVCGEKDARNVTVTKHSSGQIVVDGSVSTNLARVRQSVYQLVAQVHQ